MYSKNWCIEECYIYLNVIVMMQSQWMHNWKICKCIHFCQIHTIFAIKEMLSHYNFTLYKLWIPFYLCLYCPFPVSVRPSSLSSPSLTPHCLSLEHFLLSRAWEIYSLSCCILRQYFTFNFKVQFFWIQDFHLFRNLHLCCESPIPPFPVL
jgi:hypothetical protein